jgi:hypothetical protein
MTCKRCGMQLTEEGKEIGLRPSRFHWEDCEACIEEQVRTGRLIRG